MKDEVKKLNITRKLQLTSETLLRLNQKTGIKAGTVIIGPSDNHNCPPSLPKPK
jgi:hypothetical protein